MDLIYRVVYQSSFILFGLLVLRSYLRLTAKSCSMKWTDDATILYVIVVAIKMAYPPGYGLNHRCEHTRQYEVNYATLPSV